MAGSRAKQYINAGLFGLSRHCHSYVTATAQGKQDPTCIRDIV